MSNKRNSNKFAHFLKHYLGLLLLALLCATVTVVLVGFIGTL